MIVVSGSQPAKSLGRHRILTCPWRPAIISSKVMRSTGSRAEGEPPLPKYPKNAICRKAAALHEARSVEAVELRVEEATNLSADSRRGLFSLFERSYERANRAYLERSLCSATSPQPGAWVSQWALP